MTALRHSNRPKGELHCATHDITVELQSLVDILAVKAQMADHFDFHVRIVLLFQIARESYTNQLSARVLNLHSFQSAHFSEQTTLF